MKLLNCDLVGSQWQLWQQMKLSEFQAVVGNDLEAWAGVPNVPTEFEKFSPMTPTKRQSRSTGKSQSWDLNSGFKHSQKMLQSGWEDAPDLGKLKRVVQHVAGLAGTEVEMCQGVTGPMLDVGMYAQGQPDCLFDFAPEPSKPVIKIGYEMVSNCNVTAKSMALRGAVLYNLAEWLKPHAVVEVVAFATYRTGAVKHTTEIIVANAEYPIDANGLAFMTAHPAAMRRSHFSLLEQMPDSFRDKADIGGCYGSASNIAEDARPEIYVGNRCPQNVNEAVQSLQALVKAVKEKFSIA